MDWKVTVIVIGIVAVGVIAGCFFFLNQEQGEERHGTYGMDLTVEIENITNNKTEFGIHISEKNGSGIRINKTVTINGHDTKTVKVPIDWDGDSKKLIKITVDRSSASVTKSFWIYSNENQTVYMKPIV